MKRTLLSLFFIALSSAIFGQAGPSNVWTGTSVPTITTGNVGIGISPQVQLHLAQPNLCSEPMLGIPYQRFEVSFNHLCPITNRFWDFRLFSNSFNFYYEEQGNPTVSITPFSLLSNG